MGTLLVFLLLVLLFFSDRVGAVGRGLGEGVRNFKRAYRRKDEPEAAVLTAKVEKAPPKLLPAKGESSAPSDETPT